jgi:ABC-type branched-subunit amino acid transport system substrate-binding protein
MRTTFKRQTPRWRAVGASILALSLLLAACGGDAEEDAADDDGAEEEPADDGDDDAGDDGEDGDDGAAGELAADFGVDVENRVLTIGALDDVSGPGSTIGLPYAIGKRIAVEQANAGELDLLPEGWTVELIERDHGYNPQNSVAEFNAIKDDVLYFATTFGTPNTLPLVSLATPEEITLYPASLSSELAINEYTPPIGAPYKVEAEHAVAHAFAEAGDDLAFGVIYQLDDYGGDGLAGAEDAAEFLGIELVGAEGVAPGESDVTAPVQALQNAGATHILLAVLPSTTGPVLGTAAQLGYGPVFYGLTASWIDAFFNPEVLPPPVYANYRWATGLPLWGEDLPGMEAFLAAYETYGAEQYPPDFYILASYTQALLGFEAFARAYEAGDVTRAGYYEALRSIDNFDAFGLYNAPIDMTGFPYATLTDTRILAPGENLEDWTVLADWATPDSWTGIDG